jgi:outer membrane protein assembly factor BamB
LIALVGLNVVALDPRTGATIWRTDSQSRYRSATIETVGSRVLVRTSVDGELIDPATGRSLRTFQMMTSDSAETVVARSNRLFVMTGDSTISAFDLTDGATLWTKSLAVTNFQPYRIKPLDGALLALRDGHRLLQLDPATGTTLGEKVIPATIASEKSVALRADDRRALYRLGDRICCVDHQAETQLWSAPLPPWVRSIEVGAIGEAATATLRGEYETVLAGWDLKTGAPLFTLPLDEFGGTSETVRRPGRMIVRFDHAVGLVAIRNPKVE